MRSGTNTYLLGTGHKRLLLDTGEGISSYHDILSSVLRSENCTIEKVLISHWHHDHVGGIHQVSNLCPNAAFSKYLDTHSNDDFQPIRDNEEFAVEGAKVIAVHTPGHTTDHLAFYMPDTGILFTGDSILGQGTAVFEHLKSYISSLKKQLNLNPKTVYPGHGPIISNAKDKIQEYINHRQQREDEIVKVFRDSGSDVELTPRDIVKVIYAKYPQSLWPAAEHGVVLHLEKLMADGKAKYLGSDKWILTSGMGSL
jgi:endoribonuclease LACTB2